MYTMYMLNQRVVSATQARAKFFDLLKNAEEGKEVVIVKRDNNKRFKLSVIKKDKKDFKKLLKEFANIGFQAPSPEEIKRIISSRFDDK